MNEHGFIEALVQNYGFRMVNLMDLPTIDFVYPDSVADGNDESFRFNCSFRKFLSSRKSSVLNGLSGKKIAYTFNESIMLEVSEIAERLGMKEQINGEINSIFSYAPTLFIGSDGIEFSAFIVKPIIDASMTWFELTKEEVQKIKESLINKAEIKPFRQRQEPEALSKKRSKLFQGLFYKLF